MKYIRLIFFSALVFFFIVCVIAFFIPSRITIFRMVNIAPQRQGILHEVGDLSKWEKWYPGFQNIELENTISRNGRIIKAKAKSVQLKIISITDTSVVVNMRKGGRDVLSTWQLNKALKTDSLALQNYMDFNLKWYPWEKFSSLLLDKGYGDNMLKGLNNLKNMQ